MQPRFVILLSPRLLRLILLSPLLLSGCASVKQMLHEEPSSNIISTPTPEQGRYEVLIGQNAEAIAELRAASAPKNPEVYDSKNPAGDEQVLGGQGYLRIGNGYYPASTMEMRSIALRQGQRVGADKVMLYSLSAGDSDNGSNTITALTVAYYVHFKPPFGASFRDLNQVEQQVLGVNGGVNIGSVIGGTPAAAANLRNGDAVLTLDGKPIQNKVTFQQMLRANAGKRVTLSICRDGIVMSRSVRIGLLPLSPHKH